MYKRQALLWVSCSDEDKVNIKPVAAFKASEVIVQEGQSVAFTDLSFDQDGQITKWTWDFGNGSSSEEQSPLTEYSVAGEYTVTLSVWDNQDVYKRQRQQFLLGTIYTSVRKFLPQKY